MTADTPNLSLLRECREWIASDRGDESPCCEGAVTGKDHTIRCDKFDLLARIDAALQAARESTEPKGS